MRRSNASKENTPSRTEIKAQAVAMMCLGHSARRTERELKAKYPGADIPHYSTLSRYLASCRQVRVSRRSSVNRWGIVAMRAANIVIDRMGELVTADPRQLMKSYETVMRVYDAQVAADK